MPPVLATAAIYLLFIGLYVAAFHGDLSALVCADETKIGRAPFEKITTGFAKRGYDGQYYYAIARNPWMRRLQGIDVPARHLRVLYPAFAWALTDGEPRLLFWGLPLVNLLVLAVLAGVGAKLAKNYGMSAWCGCLLPIVANAYMPAFRNLTDPLALLAVALLLAGWLRGWPWWAMLLCGLATVLSREQNLLVVAIVGAASLYSRRFTVTMTMATCVLAWVGWIAWLWAAYGEWPFLRVQGNLTIPLSGMMQHLQQLVQNPGSKLLLLSHLFGVGLLFLQIGLAVYVMTLPGSRVVKIVMISAVVLALCAGVAIYASPWSVMRLFAWLPLGVWLISMQRRKLWPVLLMLPALLWPVVVIVQAWMLR